MVEPLWETEWRFPNKLKIELPYDSARDFQVVLVVKNLPANTRDIRDRVQSLGWEDPLKEMAAPSSIFG